MTALVPGFSLSDEYTQLVGVGDHLPGVVCGAFAKYFIRLEAALSADPTSRSDGTLAALDACVAVVEMLSICPDPDIRSHAFEVIETLEDAGGGRERLLALLGPHARCIHALGQMQK